MEMENWISLHSTANEFQPPTTLAAVPDENLGEATRRRAINYTLLPYSVDSERKERNEKAMPRVSNSVATGITSDLAAECDLKAFYDRNYFFTILPFTELFFPDGAKNGKKFSPI